MTRCKNLIRLAAAMAITLVVAANSPAQAAVAPEQIAISGSSWSSNAMNVWVADVKNNGGLRVVWTSSGSAQGRKDFGNLTVDSAVSDIGYQGTDSQDGSVDLPCKLGSTAAGNCRAYAYLPIVAGGTSFPYHIVAAGKPVENLRLSGLTLAKIFTGAITNWNDPAVTKDNNGRQLPSLTIIPVNHAEGSGSTAQFTTYLNSQFPSIWQKFSGLNGFTEYYPRTPGAISQSGSDSVINFINSAAANGSIGYDEYSYALAKSIPVVKVENAAGYYTLPNQYNVAVSLTKAKINMDKSSPNYLLQDLSQVFTYNAPQVYPLSSYSYMIIPTAADDKQMTTGKRQTLADFLGYSICDGQGQMGPIGYSPLPLNLVQASFDQTAKLKVADPKVDVSKRSVTSCNNPTFVKGNLSANRLAQLAPVPPSCDRFGQGPCVGQGDNGTVTITVRPAKNPTSASNKPGVKASNAANAPSGSTGPAGAAGNPTPKTGKTPTGKTASGAKTATVQQSGSTTIDPDTGAVISNDGTTSNDVQGVPTELAAYRQQNMTGILAPLAVLEMLAVLLLPPAFYLLVLRRRRKSS